MFWNGKKDITMFRIILTFAIPKLIKMKKRQFLWFMVGVIISGIATSSFLKWPQISSRLIHRGEWDSTYRPPQFKTLIDDYLASDHDTSDVVFLGNSITYYGEWSARLSGLKYRNYGVPSDITFGVLDRLDSVIQRSPSKIFILIGINDIAKNIPDKVILRNYSEIIRRIKQGSPRTEICIQSIFPINPTFPKHSMFNVYKRHITTINDSLKILAKNNSLAYIDIYSSLIDSNENLKEDYTWDGVHLTTTAYNVWLNILRTNNYL